MYVAFKADRGWAGAASFTPADGVVAGVHVIVSLLHADEVGKADVSGKRDRQQLVRGHAKLHLL